MKTRTKESKRRLHSLILLTAFTAVLLIVSTYAWFTTQKNVSIKTIRGKVEVAEGLEISLDAKKWVSTLDLGAEDVSLTEVPSSSNDIVYGPYTEHNNQVTEEFLPVSSSGETECEKANTATVENMDNLIMYSGKYAGQELTDIAVCTEGMKTGDNGSKVLKDENAGYFAFDIFIKNSSKNTQTSGEVLQLDSNSKVWVLPSTGGKWGEQYAGNKDAGLQNAVRVAFAKFGNAVAGQDDFVPGTAAATTVIERTQTAEIYEVAIWEPFADAHVQYIVDNVKPIFDESMGTTEHGYLTATTGNAFFTRTIQKTAVADGSDKKIEDVFDWKETVANTPTNTKLKVVKSMQTADNKAENGLISTGVTNIETIEPKEEGSTEMKELTIEPNSITKMRIYIWIEGQDPDCVNYASYGGGLDIELGFTKGLDEGGGQSASGSEAQDPSNTNTAVENTTE